jgi:hypothetical protein
MKKVVFGVLFVLMGFGTMAQSERVDTIAVMVLDRMSEVIGDLTSVSFDLSSSYDEIDQDFGMVRHSGNSEVYMTGPDKMLIHTTGDKGHRGFWYNGREIVFYSFDENNYAVVEAPADIMSTIDTIHKTYGIEFPAADFFYPTFTDDLLEAFNTIVFLGIKQVAGKECFHILASNPEMRIQFWIANDAYNLPVRFLITYTNKGNIQYEGTFSNWKINPDIPGAIYEFLPPPNANMVILIPKSTK